MTNESSDRALFGEENEGYGGAPDMGHESGQDVEPHGPKSSGGTPLQPDDPNEPSHEPQGGTCHRVDTDPPPAGGGVHGPGGLP